MGFSEFINGMSAEQVARTKELEKEQELLREHAIEEDYLAVLRPRGDLLPPVRDRFGLWKASQSDSHRGVTGIGGLWGWWSQKFPESWRLYGAPVHWDEANLDFLASALGELPLGILYYPADAQFYFRDYAFESAYRPVSQEKITALAKKLVNESVHGAPLSLKEATRPLFYAAGGWVEHAKALLAVESHFFHGKHGHRRWAGARYIEAVEKPSVELFAEKRVEPRKGQVLSAPHAYQCYAEFCQENGLPAVKKTVFRVEFAREVKKRWKLGVRNDLKADGRSFQGWRELMVK